MSKTANGRLVVQDADVADRAAEARHQKALLKAGALQYAILTSANFSIIATDEKGIIQLFNAGAERMLGYTAAEVVNRISPSDIHDPQEVTARAQALSLELATIIAPGFEALAFKASRGIEDTYELTYICKDGSRFPAVVSITALRDDYGDIIGYLLIGTDNSVRKRVESELNEAMAAAEKANLAKSDFLSSMSHELRTPLNAILGFAQLMAVRILRRRRPPRKESLDQILKAGWYLLKLINEILDLAMIESGKVTLSREPVSLAEVMLECQAMIEPQAQKRGIRMTFPRFDIPCFVQADRTRVKQVLINLLSNAIKYNQPSGTVDVKCTESTPERIRVSVTGHRCGTVSGTAGAAVPAVQSSRTGGRRRGRHGHRPGGDQATGRTDGGRHRRGKHRRGGKRVLVRTAALSTEPQLATRRSGARGVGANRRRPRMARRYAPCSMWRTIRRT